MPSTSFPAHRASPSRLAIRASTLTRRFNRRRRRADRPHALHLGTTASEKKSSSTPSKPRPCRLARSLPLARRLHAARVARHDRRPAQLRLWTGGGYMSPALLWSWVGRSYPPGRRDQALLRHAASPTRWSPQRSWSSSWRRPQGSAAKRRSAAAHRRRAPGCPLADRTKARLTNRVATTLGSTGAAAWR